MAHSAFDCSSFKETQRRYSLQLTASSQNERLCACCTSYDTYEFCPGFVYFTVNWARRIYVLNYQVVLLPAYDILQISFMLAALALFQVEFHEV
jgi:hypothetical protein